VVVLAGNAEQPRNSNIFYDIDSRRFISVGNDYLVLTNINRRFPG
jgi:hypothetical protein